MLEQTPPARRCQSPVTRQASRLRAAPAAAALLAAGALAATGCGQNDRFITDYNQSTASLRQRADQVAKNPALSPAQLTVIAAEFDATATKLRRLDPPADVRDELQAVATAIEPIAADIRLAASASRAHDHGEIVEALTDAQADLVTLATAEQALKAAVE
jgi:hypothetical protein